MSLITERPNRPVPLTTVAENLSKEQVRELIEMLRYYADSDNYEDEMDGDAFIPGTSSIVDDGGMRARRALKEMGLR